MNVFAKSALISVPLALAATLLPLVGMAAPAPAQADVTARIDSYVRGRLPSLRTPGLAVVVVDGDQVLFRRGYGFADRATGRPMTDDTPVGVGSTNKGMTALAVMQLVEQGLVDLDTPVVQYLPDFRLDDPRADQLTVRQLLSHTAGLPEAFSPDFAQDDQALERQVASLGGVTLHRDPGTGFEYANNGYAVAGLLVQTVAGVPYEQYMAEHVFAPLGMDHTTFDPGLAGAWGLAHGYAKRRGVLSPGPLPLARGYNPAGMVLTTAQDVGRYFVALLNGGVFDGTQVILPASLDQMWTPAPGTADSPYGFGWGILDTHGVHLVEHGGDLAAPGVDYATSASDFLLVPDRHLGVGVLTNLSSLEKSEIAQDVMAIVLGDQPQPRPAPVDWRTSTFVPDRAAWSALVGEYQTGQGPMRIVRDGDTLRGAMSVADFELVPLSETSFVILSDLPGLDEVPVELRRQADGSVVLLIQGQPFGLKKELSAEP